jgi:hypothetical protein
MARNKSSISKASTYEEIGEFWDTHDLADYWDQTKPVEFEVELKSETTLFALESSLSSRIRELAIQRGVSPETLLNLWVQEKLQEEAA